jgi:hypothetical protein
MRPHVYGPVSAQTAAVLRAFPSDKVKTVAEDTDLNHGAGTVRCRSDRRELSVSLPRAATRPGASITVWNDGPNRVFIASRGNSKIGGMNRITLEPGARMKFDALDKESNTWLPN